MEDRITPGLYVELGDMDPARYARSRARMLGAMPGVSRVSWWKNLVYERKDLPRTIPDGRILGVAELDDGEWSAPDALEGFASHHFVRYPRPGQGILSGRPTTGLLVVWISPRSLERAQELRDWGDFVHIRHIAAASVPGFTRISVYENASDDDPMFMHFYELDPDDPDDTEPAFSKMSAFVGARIGGPTSEAYEHWADLRSAGGRLNYCNTFGFLGELAAAKTS